MAQIKIKQLSDDFSMKSKEIIDTLQSLNIDKKTGASVDPEEFEILVHALTRIKSYLDYGIFQPIHSLWWRDLCEWQWYHLSE